MSRVDDRIRMELRRLSVPVDGGGAFARVDGRRRRLRTMRRVRLAALVTAVIAGTVVGGLGLRAVFRTSGGPRPGVTGPTPSPSYAPSLEPVRLCVASSSIADLDGDGADDRIAVGVPLPEGAGPCEDLRLEGYVARIELATGTGRAHTLEQALPLCEFPGQCWVLATPDLNDDGSAEVAIEYISGASTLNFALFRFEPASPDVLQRLDVLEPGDPFDEMFGIPAGPATFSWYGSVTHVHWLACEEGGRFAVVTVLRDEGDPSLDEVHTTVFAILGDSLRIERTEDETVPDGSLDYPPDMCGSPLISGPAPGHETTV